MPGQISFKYTEVPPPAPLYVTKDDVIRVTAYNSLSGQSLLISGRILTPQQDVVLLSEEFGPTTDRSEATHLMQLMDGFLLSLCVVSNGVVTVSGQTFVRAGIQKSEVYANRLYQIFFADYVVSGSGLHWPPGRIRSPEEGPGLIRRVLGTDPGAGSEISETVPTNALWILHGIQYTLVTDATVADRVSDLVIDDGTNEVFRAFSFFNHTASKTVIYQRAAYGTRGDAPPDYRGIFSSIPPNLRLRAGWRIRTDTEALQTGDNYSAPILYVEELLSG